MKAPRPFRARAAIKSVLALTFALASASAQAQLRLPPLNLPIPARLGTFNVDPARAGAAQLLDMSPLAELGGLRELQALRLDQVAKLLQRHGDILETDRRGNPVVRRELLAWSPSAAALDLALAAGMTVQSEQRLDSLDEALVVLRAPPGADLDSLLARLRDADPAGTYDFNHLYLGSGVAAGGPPATGGPDTAAAATGLRIGLIDSGVDAGHAVFAGTALQRWGCDDGDHPAAHGTAVAALMVGNSPHFRGVAPRASLYAADVYCGSGSGGSAARIAAALAWMASQQVGVVNLSIVGPANATLGRAIAAMLRRGHLLVAAVGNDGPAAPPLYPASYPGVVGVSAVDRRGQVLPEAARGPQVMFAAPGNQMVSASVGAPPYRPVRGTSFAAPIVAALLAPALPRPDVPAARAAVATLAQQARRDDPATVSNETGYGVVGTAYRIDPASFK